MPSHVVNAGHLCKTPEVSPSSLSVLFLFPLFREGLAGGLGQTPNSHSNKPWDLIGREPLATGLSTVSCVWASKGREHNSSFCSCELSCFSVPHCVFLKAQMPWEQICSYSKGGKPEGILQELRPGLHKLYNFKRNFFKDPS